ncbi:Integrase/recombinase xerD [Mycena sanguinolenta]|uniref:Integrase/recombinase xerD n=1 Tax=Mycena sanguinolenta TaxID=230812 RepID=A0A8H6XE65_9AGAR|nr:Integrase/recombinase xerD [Mycena sanguinolenta]
MPAIKLRPEAWACALGAYPDRVFAETLVSAIRHGVLLGVDPACAPPASSSIPPPLPSALEFPETVDKDLENEVRLGRIIDITDSASVIRPLLSPLGSVPKKYSTKRRRIHHLSYPRGASLNDAIPVEYGHLVYDAVLATIDRIRSAGQGCYLYKADLEAAFRHIAIHPSHTRFMGFEWKGRQYLDVFLPFGIRTGPRIYNYFAEAHHWILLSRDEVLRLIQHYLDDWLNVTPALRGVEYARHGRDVFRTIAAELGFSLSSDKEEAGQAVSAACSPFRGSGSWLCQPFGFGGAVWPSGLRSLPSLSYQWGGSLPGAFVISCGPLPHSLVVIAAASPGLPN